MVNNFYNNQEERDWKISYWYVSNRVILRRLMIFLMGLAAGGLILYGIYGLFTFYIVDFDKNTALQKDLSTNYLNYQLLPEVNAPKSLQITGARMLPGENGNYDFIGEVVNPNIQWTVDSFDYYFDFGGNKTEVKTDFILPGQKKFALNLAFKSPSAYTSVEMKIENVKWKKVANYADLQNRILAFDFPSRVITPPTKSQSGKEEISTVSFDINNKGPFNFWSPRFIILYYNADRLIGVNQVVLDSINSGEVVKKNINVFSRLPVGTKIEIYPDINILNPDIFKSSSGVGELK